MLKNQGSSGQRFFWLDIEIKLSCEMLMFWSSIESLFFLVGIKESDTGLAPPALWDLAADKQTLQSE